MRARMTALAATLGCAATLGLTAPATAATTPTISVPASRQGYGPITITGTAAPGATVELYESAYVFNDFYPSPDYTNGGYITTKATSAGKYTLTRILDSGFRFYVKADGLTSSHVAVAMGIVPTLTLTTSSGTTTATVTANPSQPNLHVHVQSGWNGVWTDLAGGYTSDPAATFTATLTGQHPYLRAVIDADPSNNLLRGATPTIVTGSPTTPTISAGAVQFTKIQYSSAKAGLNNEWARLTNKTKTTINLKGWTVRDAANHTYKFATDTKLAAGKNLYLYTGKGTNSTTNRYWKSSAYIWNNGGDTAYLRTAAGKTIDTCKWAKGSGTTTC
ncbi:lamin tail domain-containing protein [Winogradskya humida]|uniref:LTD domain-containing protein n=1 Tax=Winogradskya humida TaxID=113566 RepID=A0ABQ3ZWW8_9ACTN|nr:lamin tail domain-containing protein [Actinoplanes humidus]GIE22687.1 hypothetical protein Ahu01nite_057890 [Actinoplanes humidus]